MAKNNTRKVELALEKKLRQSQEIYKDRAFLNNLAKETAEQVKRRTRLGKGINSSGKNERLKQLKESYKKVRKKYSGNLDKDTSPGKSNLTATGQLLNALRGVYKNRSIIIDFDKESRGKTLTGRKDSVKNSELVGYQEDKGRRFFDLSDSELNGLRRKIANRIRKLLEK